MMMMMMMKIDNDDNYGDDKDASLSLFFSLSLGSCFPAAEVNGRASSELLIM
jgi:hypothetical protein